eukprot:7800307-Alexandrium_andersonii.AAC.1
MTPWSSAWPAGSASARSTARAARTACPSSTRATPCARHAATRRATGGTWTPCPRRTSSRSTASTPR